MRLLLELYRFHAGDSSAEDLLQTAAVAIRNGEAVTLLTASEPGHLPQLPSAITVRRFPGRSWLPDWVNYLRFADEFARLTASDNYDVTIAFDELPDADFHIPKQFDGNLKLKFMDCLLPRRLCSFFLRRKLYLHPSATILCHSSNRKKRNLIQNYGVPPTRLLALPPVLPQAFADIDEKNIEKQRLRFRNAIARKLHFPPSKRIIIQISDSWKNDGVERSVKAMAALPKEWRYLCVFIIAGRAGSEGKLLRLADKYHLEPETIRYAGTEFNERKLLLSADLLLHPAQKPCAAPHLIHALACHLPIICTAQCAYSPHVLAAMCPVIPSPFHQETLEDALTFTIPELHPLRKAMTTCVQKADFTGRAAAFYNAIRHYSRHPVDKSSFSEELTEKLVTIFKRNTIENGDDFARFSIQEGKFSVRRIPRSHWWDFTSSSADKIIDINRALETFMPKYRGILAPSGENCVYLCARDYCSENYATTEYLDDDDVQTRFTALGMLLGQIHNAGIFLDDASLERFAFSTVTAHECPYRAYMLNCNHAIRTAPPLPYHLRGCNVAQLLTDTDKLDGITPESWQTLVASFRSAYQKALYMNEKDARIFWIQVWDIVRTLK